MDYTISYFTWSFWDTYRIPHDQASPSQTHRCPEGLWFPPKWSRDHFWPITKPVKPMPINIGTDHIQPLRSTWVVLWLFFFRSTPQRSLILGPLSRVHFGESLVNRLYSEIDQTYLSIEAQCVSHYYPRWTATHYTYILDCFAWRYQCFYMPRNTTFQYSTGCSKAFHFL